jgi:hypothetical protein
VRSSGFFSRADDVQLSALIGKKGSNAVLFKYFAGCDPRAIFEAYGGRAGAVRPGRLGITAAPRRGTLPR